MAKRMEATKLLSISFLLAIFTFCGTVNYARENGNEGSVFLSGKIGSSDKLVGCSGSCSADPSGTIGIGYDFSYMAMGGPVRLAVGLAYSRERFSLNGKVLDVKVKRLLFPRNRFSLSSQPWFVSVSWRFIANGSHFKSAGFFSDTVDVGLRWYLYNFGNA